MFVEQYENLYEIVTDAIYGITNKILSFELLTGENLEIWEDIRKTANYEQLGFSINYLNYYKEYNLSIKSEKVIFPTIIFENGKPKTLVLIEFSHPNYETEIIEMQLEFLDQIAKDANEISLIEKNKNSILGIIDQILFDTPIKNITIKTRDTINSDSLDAIFLKESSIDIRHYYVLELEDRNQKFIWQNIRKSYKNLINQQLKKFNFTILDSGNFRSDFWEKFEKLHVEVAGFRSRSRESWRLQSEQILKDEGFSLMATKNNQLIGGALFLCSKQETYYGVGAYIRNDKNLNCSHAIQYLAIMESLKRGKKKHILGEKNDQSTTSDPKLLGISNFKKGFSSHYEKIKYFNFNLKTLDDKLL